MSDTTPDDMHGDMHEEEPFFIGWATPERRSWGFLATVSAAILLIAGSFSYLVAATQDDPGDGGRMGPATAIGILETQPYPVLHVLESDQYDTGATILLMGQGKNGAQRQAAELEGGIVIASGVRMSRGELDGMILRGGARGLTLDMEGMRMPGTEDMGRWRLTGELCDGNCLAGAMRPGTGLAHRACANLCILGGLPPVLVATDSVGGSEFFLVGGPDGGPMPEELLDFTGVLLEAEGRVERRGGLNVFLVDPETVVLAR